MNTALVIIGLAALFVLFGLIGLRQQVTSCDGSGNCGGNSCGTDDCDNPDSAFRKPAKQDELDGLLSDALLDD